MEALKFIQSSFFIISDCSETVEGRLGPGDVTFQFDINTNVGTLIVDQDRLGVIIKTTIFFVTVQFFFHLDWFET